MKDFIMVFPDAVSSVYCEKLMERFEFFKKTRGEGRGKIWDRQTQERSTSKLEKEDETYFLGGDGGNHLPPMPGDDVLYATDSFLLEELTRIVWHCYDQYAKEFAIISTLERHFISPAVRIQKTQPGGGYHIWHTDNGNMYTSRRIIVLNLYLNTVEEGGETEFLYQNKRVSAEQGTMLLFPASWTHVHRGNPPLAGNKYIATSWIEMGKGE